MTDKERLDTIQELATGYGNGWILRKSNNGRGLRLHESTRPAAIKDIRKAIDNYLSLENLPF